MAIDVTTVERAWPRILDQLENPEIERAVKTWLRSPKVRPLHVSDETLLIECPTVLYVQQINKRLAELLIPVVSNVLGEPITKIDCRVSRRSFREHREQVQRHAVPAQERVHQERKLTPIKNSWGSHFKQLQDFVVGSCNRLAYDAISRIIDAPDNKVNPLFIHASSGLGKTHLVQGLALAFRDRYPSYKVQYLRCEQFTNDYIAACTSREGLQAFRVKMRHVDLLLLDDLHFLSRGTMEKTKRELFDTFNELADKGKKVVITSDAAPVDIKYLESSFIQRFIGGLVVPLDRPDLQLRREIVRSKASSQGVVLNDEVIDYIADNITENVRELEGAVNKITACAHSFDRKIDMTLIRQALADVVGRDGEEPQLRVILRAVADYFDLSVEDIMGKGRAEPRPLARHIAMYVYKMSGSETYASVGNVFGGKNHNSVTYACQKVVERRSVDPDLDRFVSDLLMRVKRH